MAICSCCSAVKMCTGMSVIFALLLLITATWALEEYAISDIISNQLKKSDSVEVLEIQLFKNNPKYNDSDCIKSSLTPILSQCLKTGVNSVGSKQRAITAAKLSICEFQVANIKVPFECEGEDDINYDDCIKSFEQTPQWWTSYSGNYHLIGDFCLQESHSFEKNEILKLFLNITRVYDELLQDFNDSVEANKQVKSEMTESLQFIKTNLSKFWNELGDSERSLIELINKKFAHLHNQFQQASSSSNELTTQINSSINNFELKIFEFDSVLNEQLARFQYQFDNFKIDQLSSMALMNRHLSYNLNLTNSFEIAILNNLKNLKKLENVLTTINKTDLNEVLVALGDQTAQLKSNINELNAEISSVNAKLANFNSMVKNSFIVKFLINFLAIFKTFIALSIVILTLIAFRNRFKVLAVVSCTMILGLFFGFVLIEIIVILFDETSP